MSTELAPIDEIVIGDRVESGTGDGRTSVDESWRAAELEMPLSDESVVFIELLRPASWFERAGASEGSEIWLELPELGIEGPAAVRAIKPAPVIDRGTGQIVLATGAPRSKRRRRGDARR